MIYRISIYSRQIFILLAIHVIVQFQLFSQSDALLTDPRDGSNYQTADINGRIWMLENLELKTSLSYGIPDTLRTLSPDFKGRWYHMNELDSICPPGWRLPEIDDWINYFNYLSDQTDGSYTLNTSETDYRLTEFDQFFDLFENGNPLQIIPAGIYEGNQFIYAPNSADYWINDLIPRKKSKEKEYKVVKNTTPGTAHIHLYNQFTHIHSHKHHLNPKKPSEIRRFMCRCIKQK